MEKILVKIKAPNWIFDIGLTQNNMLCIFSACYLNKNGLQNFIALFEMPGKEFSDSNLLSYF